MTAASCTPVEVAAAAASAVATLGVIALAVFPALGWAIVVGTPVLAVVAAAVSATIVAPLSSRESEGP